MLKQLEYYRLNQAETLNSLKDKTFNFNYSKKMDFNPNTYFMYMTSVQSGAIRTLVELLKEALNDVNFIFDETGVRVTAMDGSHVALIHMKLEASKCEEFFCKEKIEVGLNMLHFFRLVKTINNSDTVSFYIKENEKNELGIIISNSDKNSLTNFKMKLLDLDIKDINIPDVDIECIITMPSNDFQRMCRDMLNISETVKIVSGDDHLRILCEGDFASQETIIGETTHGLVFNKNDNVVSGKFSLKYLNLFTKGTNLCNTIELYMKNNYPLILKYNIANLGEIRFCLAPKEDI